MKLAIEVDGGIVHNIDPKKTYSAFNTQDGGQTWAQHATCSGEQALYSITHSTDPTCLRFVEIP